MFAIIPADVHVYIIVVYMIMMYLGVCIFFVYLMFGWYAYNAGLLLYEGTTNYPVLWLRISPTLFCVETTDRYTVCVVNIWLVPTYNYVG
jgi:hypothetical protein